MIQEILVYVILIISFGISLYKFIGFFGLFKTKASHSACGTCTSGGCGSCSIGQYQHLPNKINRLKIDTEKIKPIIKQ